LQEGDQQYRLFTVFGNDIGSIKVRFTRIGKKTKKNIQRSEEQSSKVTPKALHKRTLSEVHPDLLRKGTFDIEKIKEKHRKLSL
jgi:hypothetical protein